MLYITFSIGERRFILESSRIVEITPLAELSPAPGAPDCVAGYLEYRGRRVPIVDLSMLLGGMPCRKHFSTRIILTQLERAEKQLIGWMVERATEMVRSKEDQLEFAADQLLPETVRSFLLNDAFL